MIDTDERYERVVQMSEKDRVEILDPICNSVVGKAKLEFGVEVLANRVFALAVLDLYKEWQQEVWDRD